MKRELDAVGGLLIVNDRAAVAAALGTALHLGQDDLPIEAARALMPPGAIIGLTANTVQHALEAVRRGADYLGVSPIFEARTTKPDAGEPAGLTLLSQVRAAVNLPLVAIGGIKQGNAAQVIAAGADGLAVVSAVVDAADPSAATRWLLEEILSAKGHKP
jgi:thiamine-phosphate diphosphorylase